MRFPASPVRVLRYRVWSHLHHSRGLFRSSRSRLHRRRPRAQFPYNYSIEQEGGGPYYQVWIDFWYEYPKWLRRRRPAKKWSYGIDERRFDEGYIDLPPFLWRHLPSRYRRRR
jgi:hypothetical protein